MILQDVLSKKPELRNAFEDFGTCDVEENDKGYTCTNIGDNMWPHCRVYTLGDLKLGLVCVTNFGESPNFLDMGCLAKTRNSQFFGHGLFCRIFTDFFLIFSDF